ncbi:MAG: sugar ABC transporter permease [Actinobacteria bacterium]|nr:sugar ABC transporter permease [Actinomycetota bacterium]
MSVAERATAESVAAPPPPAPPRGSNLQRAERRLGNALVLPGQLLLLLLVLFPVAMEVYISLTAWTPTSGRDWYSAYKFWVWFDNFGDGLTSPSFLSTALRTVLMTVGAVGVEFVLGFGLALLFVDKFPGQRLATVLLLLPMMIVPAVSGFVFYLLLQTDGPVNTILAAILPGNAEWQWLSDPSLTPISVVLVDVWQWTPLMFLILLSGLLAVPEDQLSAARILGASWWQRMRYVVLPIMKPILIIALIIRGMEAFKIFDAAWLLTQGGPGEASATISVKLYREAFLNAQWSYVAALAIVVMIAVSIVASQAVKPIEKRQAGQA